MMSARTGANGFSSVESNAVWVDGKRRAPSDKVTDATANTSSKQTRTGKSVVGTDNGSPNAKANGSNNTDGKAAVVDRYMRQITIVPATISVMNIANMSPCIRLLLRALETTTTIVGEPGIGYVMRRGYRSHMALLPWEKRKPR